MLDLASCRLPPEAVLDLGSRLLRGGDLFVFPEDFLYFQALDPDLAAAMEAFPHPDYPRASALNPPLQQDLVSRMEVVPGGVDARSRRRYVERADVRRSSRRQKIDSQWNDYRAALLADLMEIFQLQFRSLFAEGLEDRAHKSDSSTNFCAVSLRIFP
jgi:hypothetical protein